MARLSTVVGLQQILDAADTWKNQCLLGSGSVFSSSSLWSDHTLQLLHRAFVENGIEGPDPFLQKFETQLKAYDPGTKQLGAEFLWLLLLFPSNIGGDKKRENVNAVWSWSGQPLDPDHPLLALLNYGIGSAGQAYSTLRYLELAFAIRVTLNWRALPRETTDRLTAEPWKFGNWLDSVQDANKRQFRHILLYLLFPDYYERIASNGHKRDIVAKFEVLLGSLSNRISVTQEDSEQLIWDKKLFAIREIMGERYPGQELDFYRSPLKEMWKTEQAKAEEDSIDEANNATDRRVWIEKTIVRGRPDREEGPNRLGAALWAPQHSKNGADIYKNMRRAQAGDLVLHLIDNEKFSGVSRVESPADDSFIGISGTAWGGLPAYRIPLEGYAPIDPPFQIVQKTAGKPNP